MGSTRIRHSVPILPRVEDLERSQQWTGLAGDIGNLERLSTGRTRARRSPGIFENSSRGRSSHRRSMLESPKPDLVYVRMTNSEDLRSVPRIEDNPQTIGRSADSMETGVVDRWSWKPRTEFERNYFGTGMETSPIVNEERTNIATNYSPPRGILTNGSTCDQATKISSVSYGNADGGSLDRSDKAANRCGNSDGPRSLAKYERPRSSVSNLYSKDIPEVSKNERRRTCTGTSFYCENGRSAIREVPEHTEAAPEVDGSFLRPARLRSPGTRDSRYPEYKKPLDVTVPRCASDDGDSEYRGSRERLHEIFEHNRLLRQRFFAGMPGGSDTNERGLNGVDPRNPLRGVSNEISTARNRLEFQKNSGSGFGSTETLTSQSNQSGASSATGRKSRVDFGISPEPSDDTRIFTGEKIDTRHSSGFGASRNALSREESDDPAFSYTHLPLPSKSAATDRPSSREDDGESLVYDVNENSRRIFMERCDRLKESPIDTTADFSMKNSQSPLENRGRTDSLDSDKKFFATYVHLQDSSNDSSKSSSPTRRGTKPIPPPLDLSMIDQRYGDRYEGERQLLKNYTVEATPLRDYDRPSRGTLTVLRDDVERFKKSKKNESSPIRGSKSLLELSANLSKSHSPSSKVPKRIFNTGLSAAVNDLRSPKLVNSFSNSMIDLIHSTDHDEGQRSSQCGRFAAEEEGEEDEEAEEEAESRVEVYSSPDSARRKSIGSTTPGTGTTLPLVYGPIPYKSPRRYVEGEVTIHYRSPVRQEAKEILSEEELARRSAENMRRVYQEERRRKYLQELHDIDSRRHTDNFVASQKSPISLNRYDDFVDDLSYRSRSQEQTPEPRLVARALYNFVGQSSRELTFRRGDIIFVRRQVDKNWYEGEHNAMIGLFPFNYVEILPCDGARTTPKKPYEGQARAKFNFVAQTNLELSLAKGEVVVITRRVDENWYEGRIGNRKGIFPISYVEVTAEPSHRSETPVQSKPVASPAAHSLLSNGTAGGKMSMGAHHYTPSIPVNTSTTQPHYNSLPRMGGNKLHVAPVNETLHIDTHSETIPYRALYNYRPQNEDELELREGDTVYVMEKCDDGWFVGSSQRTAYFGTFPGNYVERL